MFKTKCYTLSQNSGRFETVPLGSGKLEGFQSKLTDFLNSNPNAITGKIGESTIHELLTKSNLDGLTIQSPPDISTGIQGPRSDDLLFINDNGVMSPIEVKSSTNMSQYLYSAVDKGISQLTNTLNNSDAAASMDTGMLALVDLKTNSILVYEIPKVSLNSDSDISNLVSGIKDQFNIENAMLDIPDLEFDTNNNGDIQNKTESPISAGVKEQIEETVETIEDTEEAGIDQEQETPTVDTVLDQEKGTTIDVSADSAPNLDVMSDMPDFDMNFDRPDNFQSNIEPPMDI